MIMKQVKNVGCLCLGKGRSEVSCGHSVHSNSGKFLHFGGGAISFSFVGEISYMFE